MASEDRLALAQRDLREFQNSTEGRCGRPCLGTASVAWWSSRYRMDPTRIAPEQGYERTAGFTANQAGLLPRYPRGLNQWQTLESMGIVRTPEAPYDGGSTTEGVKVAQNPAVGRGIAPLSLAAAQRITQLPTPRRRLTGVRSSAGGGLCAMPTMPS